jgi:hypothetical protein
VIISKGEFSVSTKTGIHFYVPILITFILLLVFHGWGNADVVNGLDFLNVPVGARASGMGGAFVAVADDASAAYWNPAGLSRIGPQVLFAHNAYIVDMKQEYVSAVTRFGEWTVAGSFNIFDIGTLEKRDDSGALLGEFRPFDLSLGISVAYPVLEDLSLGATAKGIMSDIDIETATGFLFDIGAIWDGAIGPVEGISAGVTVRNLGPSLTFIDEPFDAPLGVRGGLAYRRDMPAAGSRFVLSFDVESMRGGDIETFVGGEWYYGEYISGRLGLNPNSDTRDFATGFGAHYRDFVVDYAYVPFTSDLGSSHRIGVTYTFSR